MSQRARGFALAGIAKGAGMIMPRMATMLAYIVTDLAVEPAFLRAALRDAVEPTFNALTIDGQTSTSDTVLVLANGAAGNRPIGVGLGARARSSRARCSRRSRELCYRLARDGEGVTKLATVDGRAARAATRDADRVARSVANSALVKTALFGARPELGPDRAGDRRGRRARSRRRRSTCASAACRCCAAASPPAAPTALRARRARDEEEARSRSRSRSAAAPGARAC